ncbi:MAG TPA: EamA family transporter, partial [Gemmatimonadales bacterium]|nr:EamA family transporter [Gemmatimonadales bacterium]
MTTPASPRSTRLVGYACALGAGSIWGTTGPLSTALYAQGGTLTGIGFWRLVLGIVGILAFGVMQRDFFRIDLRGWLLVGLGGGVLVALFEVAYQFAISGAGVAGAAALLYTAPVLVAVLAVPLLGERLTPMRLVLALVVMAGAALAVLGGSREGVTVATTLRAGVVGGGLAALSYAGTTLLARYAVPRYGPMRVLFLEILGGIGVLGVVLPLAGRAPAPPPTSGAWLYTALLAAGTVVAANVLFFNAAKRIDAAPTAVAATIEPVVSALLAFALFAQRLTPLGWIGLLMVVGGVAGGYLEEA